MPEFCFRAQTLHLMVCMVLLFIISSAKSVTASAIMPENKTPNLQVFPENVSMPLKVGVSVFFNSITRINDAAGSFNASVDLTLRWFDPRLKFDPDKLGTDRQEFSYEAATAKLATLWTPRIIISNDGIPQTTPLVSNEYGFSHSAMKTDTPKVTPIESGLFIFADGSVQYTQRFKTTFENQFKLDNFPFDIQILTIKVSSSQYSINKIELIQNQKDRDRSGVNNNISIAGWELLGVDFVDARTRSWDGDYLPEIEAQLSIKRDPAAYLISIFIPFVLLMLVPTTLTLYTRAEFVPRLMTWAGSIMALIALNYTLSFRYPMLDVHSIVMQLLTIGFCYQMLMVILTVTLFNPAVASKFINKYLLAEMIDFVRWAIPLAFFSVIVISSMLNLNSG